jgi:putative acetyltransferase
VLHNKMPSAFEIRADDLSGPEVAALLSEHLASVALHSPPESVHALNLENLRSPEVSFWSAGQGSELLGCGALKELNSIHGELKSMRTASSHLRKGVARSLLKHMLDVAQKRGYRRLSLETGSMEAFAPARALYARFGFRMCEPFSDYVEDPYSVFMTRELERERREARRDAELLRGLYVLWCDVTHMLRKLPLVPFRVFGPLSSVTVKMVLRFLENSRTRLFGLPEVLVHVVHEHIEALGRLAEFAWIPVVRCRTPEHENAVRPLYLGMHDRPVRTRHSHSFFKTECSRQPFQRASHVLIVKVRSDEGHVLLGGVGIEDSPLLFVSGVITPAIVVPLRVRSEQ